MADTCENCGSDKIIPNVALEDRMHDFGMMTGQAAVSVAGKPGALLFKDAVTGSVFLRICCECGRAEIRVTNGQALWEKYQQALQQ